MSQQPPPKQSMVQTMLLMAIIWLGIWMFFGNKNNNAADTRTADEVLAQMREKDAGLYLDIDKDLGAYDTKVRAEKMSRSQQDALILDAQILAAHTHVKAGLAAPAGSRDGFNQINNAFLQLLGQHERYGKLPIWQEPIAVSPSAEMPETKMSPAQLYDRMTQELSRRNKTQLAWGIMPGWAILDFLVNLTGRNPGFSYAFAALVLALCVRGAVWPLSQRQMMWGRQMQQLQPLVKELQAKHKDKNGKITNPQEFQMESMNLYKEYGINPMAGCWPMAIQMPLFLLIYQCMLLYKFDFQRGVFLWIHPGTGSFLGIPLAPNLGERDYILVAIYAVTMIVTTLLAPISDPANAKQQRLIGVSMAAVMCVVMFFYVVPSAFVLYWIFTNMLATAQSLRAYRLPVPPLVKVNAPGGGVYPVNPIVSNGKVDTGLTGKTGAPKTAKPKRKKK